MGQDGAKVAQHGGKMNQDGAMVGQGEGQMSPLAAYKLLLVDELQSEQPIDATPECKKPGEGRMVIWLQKAIHKRHESHHQ